MLKPESRPGASSGGRRNKISAHDDDGDHCPAPAPDHFYLFYKAAPILSLEFLLENPIHGMRSGGIWAPLGTIYLVLICFSDPYPGPEFSPPSI